MLKIEVEDPAGQAITGLEKAVAVVVVLPILVLIMLPQQADMRVRHTRFSCDRRR